MRFPILLKNITKRISTMTLCSFRDFTDKNTVYILLSLLLVKSVKVFLQKKLTFVNFFDSFHEDGSLFLLENQLEIHCLLHLVYTYRIQAYIIAIARRICCCCCSCCFVIFSQTAKPPIFSRDDR